MKKIINILTFHDALNYGAVMQAYALSRMCRVLGFEVRIVNLKWSDFLLLRSKKEWHFRRFRSKYLPTNTLNAIHKLEDFYSDEKLVADYWIVGSDQVWNLDIIGELYPAFFLDFVKQGEKISYAASFGGNSWKWDDVYKNNVKKYLDNFQAVSTRERSGVDICQKIFGINAKHVIDPTLLIDDYSMIIGKKQKISKELVSYKFVKSSSYYDVLKEMKNILGLAKVKELSSLKPCFIKNVSFPIQISVENWLQRIRDAAFVATDSFHGICFCLIFEKQFVYIPGMIERAERVIDLLTMLGLENRIFKNVDEIRNDTRWLTSIDYTSVKEKLNVVRNDSLNFLKENLHV